MDIQSHPAWVRGLKRRKLQEFYADNVVAPCVGAWIETCSTLPYHSLFFSHPSELNMNQSDCYVKNVEFTSQVNM